MTLTDIIHHHGNYDVELTLSLMISLSKLFTAEKKNRLIISSPTLIQKKDMGFLLVLLVPCNSNWDLNLHSWDLKPVKTQIGT